MRLPGPGDEQLPSTGASSRSGQPRRAGRRVGDPITPRLPIRNVPWVMTYERPMGRRSRSTTGLLDLRWVLQSTRLYKQVLPRRPPATLPSTSVVATRCDQGSAHIRRLSGDDRTHRAAGARGRPSEGHRAADGDAGTPTVVPRKPAAVAADVPQGNLLIIWAMHGESADRRQSAMANRARPGTSPTPRRSPAENTATARDRVPRGSPVKGRLASPGARPGIGHRKRR